MEIWYDVFGIRLVLRSPNRALISYLRRMDSSWCRLVSTPEKTADVEIDVIHHAEPSVLLHVQDFANDRFFLHASRHRLITGHCFRRPWQIHIQGYRQTTFRMAHALVAPTMLNLIERRGLSTLHAAAVADRGRGVLLSGDSGSGKSTTALALATQGFDFLTDNDVYLESTRSGLRARSRGGTLRLRHDTRARVTGLPAFAHFPLSGKGKRRKHSIDPGVLTNEATIAAAPIRLLLFPRVGRGSAPAVRPLDPGAALDRLLASYPLGGSLRAVIKDVHAQRARFDRLSRLVATAPAYTLTLGRDLGGVGDLVRNLLR